VFDPELEALCEQGDRLREAEEAKKQIPKKVSPEETIQGSPQESTQEASTILNLMSLQQQCLILQ